MFVDYNRINEFMMQEPELTFMFRRQLLHESHGTFGKLWHQNNALLLDHWCLQIYGEEQALEPLLAELEPGKKYDFFAIPSRYLPLLERHFEAVTREQDCSVYTLSADDFSSAQVRPLDSLALADAPIIDSHWEYRFEGSVDFFRHILASYPSSAIRIDDTLAGWSVCYGATDDFVNMGALMVLPEYRKQGLGRLLALDLAAKTLATGKKPLVHILDTNSISQHLSQGIGFRRHPGKVFWGSGIKK